MRLKKWLSGSCRRRAIDIPAVRSKPPKRHKNDDDDQDNPDDADPAMTVAVAVAAESTAEVTEQEDDEDDDRISPSDMALSPLPESNKTSRLFVVQTSMRVRT
jgi:hypothetical protein